jgi:hypothetical protein
MRRILNSLTMFAAYAVLQGCSDNKADPLAKGNESNAVTQTRMDDIDNMEGTISDEMIITDDSTDEGALESAESTSSSAQPAKGSAKADAVVDADTGDE